MRELTIMYMCWCEQRKRLQAYIANLKTHLVRQIQVRHVNVQGVCVQEFLTYCGSTIC